MNGYSYFYQRLAEERQRDMMAQAQKARLLQDLRAARLTGPRGWGFWWARRRQRLAEHALARQRSPEPWETEEATL